MTVTQSHNQQVLVTKREAADALRVTVRTIDRYIAEGRLAAVRISPRTTRVVASSLAALLESEVAS